MCVCVIDILSYSTYINILIKIPKYITSLSERYARTRAKPGPDRLVYTILAKMSVCVCVCVCVCVSIRISLTRDPFSVRKTTGDKVGQRGFNR